MGYLVLEKIVMDEKIYLELYWGKIYQIKDDGGELKFLTLSEVVKKFLSLAEANAPVESAFSQIKHLIGKDGNRLLPETVNALMVTKSHIQSTSSYYNQDINENLMHDVRNSRRLYFDGKKNNDNNNDLNNNEPGPSGIQLEEEKICKELKYEEDMIRVNRESANRLLEETLMLMNENKKRSRNADDLRKKHEKVLEMKWRKGPRIINHAVTTRNQGRNLCQYMFSLSI